MPAVKTAKRRIFPGFIALLILSLMTVTACKKESEESETGGLSMPPVSLLSAGARGNEAPSTTAHGLNIPITSTQSTLSTLPTMETVPGTDTSVRMTTRMKEFPGWQRAYVRHFTALHDCLGQVDGGAAYVTDIKSTARGITINLYGLDEQHYHCISAHGEARIEETTQEGTASLHDVIYYPRITGSPVLPQPECYNVESVVTRPQGLIGWMAFKRDECA